MANITFQSLLWLLLLELLLELLKKPGSIIPSQRASHRKRKATPKQNWAAAKGQQGTLMTRVSKMMYPCLMILDQHGEPRRLASSGMLSLWIQRSWRGLIMILRKWMMAYTMSNHLMNKRLALIIYKVSLTHHIPEWWSQWPPTWSWPSGKACRKRPNTRSPDCNDW